MAFPLKPPELRSALEMLTGKSCDTQAADPWTGDGAVVAAVFVTDDGAPAVAFVAEPSAAGALGAATKMVPPGMAEEAAKDKCVPEPLADCLREIVNVLGAVLNDIGTAHVVLQEVWLDEGVPEVVANLLAEKTRTFQVEVEGYGAGRVSFSG